MLWTLGDIPFLGEAHWEIFFIEKEKHIGNRLSRSHQGSFLFTYLAMPPL